jgi:hypothetical protein
MAGELAPAPEVEDKFGGADTGGRLWGGLRLREGNRCRSRSNGQRGHARREMQV